MRQHELRRDNGEGLRRPHTVHLPKRYSRCAVQQSVWRRGRSCQPHDSPQGASCPFTQVWVIDHKCWSDAWIAAHGGQQPSADLWATEFARLTGLTFDNGLTVRQWMIDFNAANGRWASEAEINDQCISKLTCKDTPNNSVLIIAGGAALALMLAFILKPQPHKITIAKV